MRSALIASGLALPARRITVNLAPADVPKEGSHYDLPIALGLMAAIGAIPPDALNGFTVLGELGLDGSIAPVAGVLPAAIGANAREEGLICPAACGAEAAWGRWPVGRGERAMRCVSIAHSPRSAFLTARATSACMQEAAEWIAGLQATPPCTSASCKTASIASATSLGSGSGWCSSRICFAASLAAE